MAADDQDFYTCSDNASIALLCRLRAGATVHFVHRHDVYSAAPADLVANLEPAPGTDGTWYFYCPKKFKNAQGKASGHRQRAISGGDTCWHAEARPKGVDGSEAAGGTACNLSYGRKEGRSFNRLGWCMMEYDYQPDNATAGDGSVLCKVYRSSRAQAKATPPSSSKSASSSSKATKRKAAASEHPEARPPKLSHGQEQKQLSTETMQQDGGEFIETPYGLLPSAEVDVGGGAEEGHALLEQQTREITVEDLLGQEETTPGEGSSMPAAAFTPPDADFFDGLEREGVFRDQDEHIMQTQQLDPLPEFVHSQWTACHQQESQWMTMLRLLQGPPSFLIC
ncbi:unnamed protein product [Urochloa humidicola]